VPDTDSSVSPNPWRAGEWRLERLLRLHPPTRRSFNQFRDLERCALRFGNPHAERSKLHEAIGHIDRNPELSITYFPYIVRSF